MDNKIKWLARHLKLHKGSFKALHVGRKSILVAKEGGGGQEPILYFSIKLSHIHIEMNKMCLKSILC